MAQVTQNCLIAADLLELYHDRQKDGTCLGTAIDTLTG